MRLEDWWRKADNTTEQSKTKPIETEQDVVYNWLEWNTTERAHESPKPHFRYELMDPLVSFRFFSFRPSIASLP
jgi:hypothetical protein